MKDNFDWKRMDGGGVTNEIWVEPPNYSLDVNTVHGVPNFEVVYHPQNRRWTWKPVQRARKQRRILLQDQQIKMGETKRTEAVLRNLAEELLTIDEFQSFKQVLHHFRVSHSVTTLCQQLKPIINSTQKLLLLVELSSRIPKSLQEDFHRLCVLQFPNYDSYLRIFTNGNSPNEMPRVIAQDSSGKFRIVSHGSEKKMMVKYNNQKQTYELRSQPGTSVTSGVYSKSSDEDSDDEHADLIENTQQTQGRATPVHLKGKKNVHKVFLHRHNDGSLGLGIKGGKDFGTEIIINVVEEGGPAASQGLKVGDKILEVNGHSFHGMTHAEAVLTIRNGWNLIILVDRTPEKQTQNPTDFVDYGRPILPIQELELIVYPSNTGRLGCVTQRLSDETLLVKKVEKNSAAYKAGLIGNDRITLVDNISVQELSEKQIVMLTNAKRLILKVFRDISIKGDTTDGYILSKGYKVMTPEKQRTMNVRTNPEPRTRDNSEESRQPAHHSPLYSMGYDKEILRPNSAPTTQYFDMPEHLVYGNKTTKDANWVLSSKPNRIHRYTQRKDKLNGRDSYPIHVRNTSEASRGRYGTFGKEYGTQNGGVSRYVRSRSHSPHRNTLAINQIHQDDHVIQAIQMGLEKRQRAIRLSLYQMPDPADYEWEID